MNTIAYVAITLAVIIIFIFYILFLFGVRSARSTYMVDNYSTIANQRCVGGAILSAVLGTFLIIFGICMYFKRPG